jgi:predicted regulator of amino acid metabolism with ACT domain
MIVTCNTDKPGVIGAVGTILGKHQINIAQFALGRDGDRAMGIVTVDEPTPVPDNVLEELRQVQAIREVRLVRL